MNKICSRTILERDRQNLYLKIIFWSFLSQMIFTINKRLLASIPYGTVIAAMLAFPYLISLLIKFILTTKIRINGKIVAVFLLVSCLYLISYLNGVPSDKVAFYYLETIYCLSLLHFSYSLNKIDELYDIFAKNGFLITLLSALIIFVDRSTFAYNMHFSYILSLILFVHTAEFLKHKTISSGLLALIELILIIIYGSRGPILCFIVFLFLYVLLDNRKNSIKVAFSIGLTLIAIYIENILAFIRSLVKNANVNSRTLSLLVENIGHMSGRDVIASASIELIKEHPVTGLGIIGEFKYLEDYPHNFILDMFLHWGIVLGLILILLVLYITISALAISKGKIKTILLVFICYGFVMLFFSGTYLSCDGFYIMLGIALNIRKKVD